MTEKDEGSLPKQNYRILSVSGRIRKEPGFSSAKSVVSVEVKRKRRVLPFMTVPKAATPSSGESSESGAPKNRLSALLSEPDKKIPPTIMEEKVEEDVQSKSSDRSSVDHAAQDNKSAPPSNKEAAPSYTSSRKKDLFDEDDDSPKKNKLSIKKSTLKTKYDFGFKGVANKINIQDVERLEERERSLASIKRARDKMRRLKDFGPKEKQIREVILPEFITVAELASRMAEKVTDVIKEYMKMGTIVTANQTIDADTAEIAIVELGHKVKRVTDADVESILLDGVEDEKDKVSRPPVVTIMGHVDHGKTSLLDALRDSDVTAGEAGGITQHIGAYQINVDANNKITFIDTPGHEAFTEMRSRGAKATDIVVLVVAADDGVKAQTIEAINHAKAAEVPIIVAVNKIDKEGADSNRVLGEILNYDLVPESMGGDIMTIEVSATKKKNLEKLKEAILLQAEMLELKAISSGRASGVVIESKIDTATGVTATVLVQKGSLKKGDIVVAGCGFGKVKTMISDKGEIIDSAMPSCPVEITGLNIAPSAGDVFAVVTEEKQARDICKYRERKLKEKENVVQSKVSLEELFSKSSKESRITTLPLLVKADVQGSIEAIVSSINKIENPELRIKILHKGVGAITESDVSLAAASGAVVVGFNVRANSNARILSDKEGVDIRYYAIIYELIDDIKTLASGLLKPIEREQYLGKAEIRQVFNISKIGKIGGSFVTEGVIKRGANVRLLRDDVVIHDGHLKTLKRFKDDVKEVSHGYECGIAFERYDDLKEGDTLEVYEIIKEKQKL